MQRKNAIKAMAFSALSPQLLIKKGENESFLSQVKSFFNSKDKAFKSNWHRMQDMEWVGPEYWGNRLQDWQIRSGKAQCSVSSNNRTLHCLTHQLSDRLEPFKTTVDIHLQNQTNTAEDYLGFRLGAKGKFEDYRSAAVFGKGLDVGITTEGKLFIGDQKSTGQVALNEQIALQITAMPVENRYKLVLSLFKSDDEHPIARLESEDVDPEHLVGNIALLSHFGSKQENASTPSAHFSDWTIQGEKVDHYPDRAFGPICFAQYTLHKKTLKLTAQCAPVEAIEGHQVHFQIKQGYGWITVKATTVDSYARTARFRIEGWNYSKDIPYRIKLDLPMGGEDELFYYEGTIAANPISSDELKTAVFSCNSHYGFPNNEVVQHVAKHQPDMAVFLGDQIYESHGGFGVQRSPVDKACLDYLRKWYMFGWSYRDIFRDIPCAIIPDDHDVYHGNVWGAGGKDAPTGEGWGYAAQDQGGYKMPPEWVNVIQRTQTSNLPDPYDPTPVKQDIGVYYTDWSYGGVSFAVLEDRKFKSAPQNVLPKEAKVKNGFIQNPDFDITQHYDVDAELLGERQLQFLEEWSADWSGQTQMKAVLSQTNFCTVATLPEGSLIDEIVPSLPTPEKGEYVEGDAPTTDMDSNGWPQKGRDEALRKIRKSFAFHIAGDQHLASTVQYGIDEFGDSGFAFAGPALNNIWPRRWWPQVGEDHQPLPGRPKNTGNFTDGFGNQMSIYAVANPVQTNREPSIIYDRATGYGIVTFNKTERSIRIECWPRYVDPEANPEGQYDGWPIVIRQEDNYGRRAVTYLPEIQVEGMEKPVVQIYNQDRDELVYTLRLKGQPFRPKVFERSNYKIRIGDPDRNLWQEYEGITSADKGPVVVSF
ncbi:alkaline phosphatase D family protein [Fodinibius salsisoli]|uniref:Alkaline phosphatase D family protein n=1 Tax=Fodinibius salsisoli TaxID=2820877 RepID=A0ABT3PQ48_9BACT|nr:alkaline phosphatase D family protein [Fodinibius salsisoli]MCW9707984.1 alkaline phosphatase D family protein [Fodinibius salsisoli]